MIIPVKSFELPLNSIHLCRHKSGDKKNGSIDSTAVILFGHTIDDVVPCTLNSIHLYRPKSKGKKQVHSKAQ